MKRPYTMPEEITDKFVVMQKEKKTKYDFLHIDPEDDDECSFMIQLLQENNISTFKNFEVMLGNHQEIIILCNAWLFKISAQYKLPDDIVFSGIYIMYRYLVKGKIVDFVKEPYLFAAVCLNIAKKIETVQTHLKPSILIANEHRLQNNSVLDMIRVERVVISHLKWEFSHIQPPQIFLNSCYNIFDIHPKIRKTAASCAKKCVLSNTFVFFSGARLSLYCLLASFMFHKHFFYYDEIINMYSIDESKEEIHRTAEKVLTIFNTT